MHEFNGYLTLLIGANGNKRVEACSRTSSAAAVTKRGLIGTLKLFHLVFSHNVRDTYQLFPAIYKMPSISTVDLFFTTGKTDVCVNHEVYSVSGSNRLPDVSLLEFTA